VTEAESVVSWLDRDGPGRDEGACSGEGTPAAPPRRFGNEVAR
jgi:hypothetical protein